MIQLRDYQRDCLCAVLEAHQEKNVTRPLVSLPTGTGKTIIFAALARELGWRTLVLAHRDELVRQAADKFSMVWPEASLGVVKADEDDFRDRQVVVASVQTLARPNRLERVAHEDFRLLVVDEAHHAPAISYRRIADYLLFMDAEPGRLLLGVTATARRADAVGLGCVFEDVVYHASILTMIRAGYLADLRGLRVRAGGDLSGVGTRHGDFAERQLARAVNTPERNAAVVAAYLEHAAGRKALAFTADVQHALDLAQAFRESGVEAAAVYGGMPEQERREILRAFSAGELQVVTNCAVLTEGYDEPSIDCILMARPTKSPVLYTQCIGRGTRLFPGKQDCLVVDFFDNRHDVCALPTLLGFSPEKLAQGKSVREALAEAERRPSPPPGKPAPRPQLEVARFDPLERSAFRWFRAGAQWRLPIAPKVYVVLAPGPAAGRWQVLLRGEDGQVRPLHSVPLDLGYAQGVAEDYARAHGRAFSRKDAPWREHPATEKQLALLRELGLSVPAGVTKGEASDILEEFFMNRRRYRA
jgi:superfamily II DNA or RNA helicase